ncbi:type IV toxin-antitoxin system AbiEi family antitoxin domain-containing protein [Brevundimonas vesicularis]
MKTVSASVPDRVMTRVRASGRGSVFTPSDFLSVATRSSVDQALSRLVKGGQLRRLARGLYDFPKLHPKLGPLSPAPDDVAHALARETGSQVQIAGARAANALGLSAQVPAQSTYLTDGPSRRVVLGKRVVDLRHASPKHLIAPGSPAGTVVQALRHVGPVRAADVAQVAARQLSASDKKTLASTALQAPAWMRPTLVSIANASMANIDG